MPYHAAKTEKVLRRADPENKLAKFLATIETKLHIWSTRRFFEKFYLKSIYLFTVSFDAAKFEKNPCNGSWEISLRNFGSQLGQNCPLCPNEDFLTNFTETIFIYLLAPITLQNLQKHSCSGSWDTDLHNFGPQPSQNCPFGLLRIFLEILFLSTYCFLSYCKVWKNFLKEILAYKLA